MLSPARRWLLTWTGEGCRTISKERRSQNGPRSLIPTGEYPVKDSGLQSGGGELQSLALQLWGEHMLHPQILKMDIRSLENMGNGQKWALLRAVPVDPDLPYPRQDQSETPGLPSKHLTCLPEGVEPPREYSDWPCRREPTGEKGSCH